MTKFEYAAVAAQAVVSAEFRFRLLNGQVDAEELLQNFKGLTSQEAAKILDAAGAGSMEGFGKVLIGHSVDLYGHDKELERQLKAVERAKDASHKSKFFPR